MKKRIIIGLGLWLLIGLMFLIGERIGPVKIKTVEVPAKIEHLEISVFLPEEFKKEEVSVADYDPETSKVYCLQALEDWFIDGWVVKKARKKMFILLKKED